jgi:hypothetical protein
VRAPGPAPSQPAQGAGPLASQHPAPAGADGVDLIDVSDAGAVFPGELAGLPHEPHHLEHVHSPEHRAEAGALNGDEGDARLAGDGLGQHGLPGAGRAGQQDAVDELPAHLHEALPVREQIDPLSDQAHQVLLAPIIRQGDLFGVAGLDDLHPAAGHKPEDGHKLDDDEGDGEEELEGEAQQQDQRVQDHRLHVGPVTQSAQADDQDPPAPPPVPAARQDPLHPGSQGPPGLAHRRLPICRCGRSDKGERGLPSEDEPQRALGGMFPARIARSTVFFNILARRREGGLFPGGIHLRIEKAIRWIRTLWTRPIPRHRERRALPP